MFEHDLLRAETLLAADDEIEPELYRFPAISPVQFRERVAAAVRGRS